MSTLNSYGLEPKAGFEWRLFEIDGWQLLAQVDENDEGAGVGIRYSTSIGNDDDVSVVSIWLGSTAYTQSLDATFSQALEQIDDEKARKALQVLLDHVGSVIGGDA